MPIQDDFIFQMADGMLIGGKSVCPHCGAETPITCYHCGNDALTAEVEKTSGSHWIDKKYRTDKVQLRCSLCFTYWDRSFSRNQDFSSPEDNAVLVRSYISGSESATRVCQSCDTKMMFFKYSELWKIEGTDPEQRVRELAQKKREQAAEREKLAKEQAAEERRVAKDRAGAGRQKAIAFLQNLTSSPALIVDSNIWMNPGYDPFFQALEDCLRATRGSLTLYGPQFDEICNVKRKTAYGTPSNRGARCALNRIERMQTSNLLHIEPLSIDAEPRVYADPLIVKLIVTHAKKGTSIAFLSDDMELRIRVRGLASNGPGKLQIIEGKDFLPICRDYCVAGGLGFDDIDADECYREMDGNDQKETKGADQTKDEDDNRS